MIIEPLFSNFIASDIVDVDCDKITEYIKTVEPGLPLRLDTPELSEIVGYVNSKIHDFSKAYGLTSKANPRLTTIWANRNNAREPLKPHIHGTHWISVIFYPEADMDSPDLIIKNPITEIMEYAVPYQFQEYATPYNRGRITIAPKKGLMIAFPAWCQHWVDPECPHDSNRYSLAFNITCSHISDSYIEHIYAPNSGIADLYSKIQGQDPL